LTRFPREVSLHALRTAALSQLGKADQAQLAAEQVRRLSPAFEVKYFGTRFGDPKYTAKIQEGLLKAGLK
jgi:hypothetical protein